MLTALWLTGRGNGPDTTAGGGGSPPVPRAAPVAPRPFPDGAAWWTPIPEDPRLDPRNGSLARALADPRARRVANLRAFAVPVYEAGPGTPRYDLEVTRRGFEDWGENILSGASVPIPEGAAPAPGANGKLVIVDTVSDLVYDMWQAGRTPTGGWSTAWGGVYPLGGDGSSEIPSYQGPNAVPRGTPLSRSTGSGVSSLAGLVRLHEIAAGEIPHALVFSSDIVCGPSETGPFRWPATTTDGARLVEPCLPEGTRVQLDPSVDLDAILGITQGEVMLGRALQTYGAYLTDNGGARMAFFFEMVKPGEPSPYADVGFTDDYFELERLPWEDLRVLARWDGR